jgi:hypothetical protein
VLRSKLLFLKRDFPQYDMLESARSSYRGALYGKYSDQFRFDHPVDDVTFSGFSKTA